MGLKVKAKKSTTPPIEGGTYRSVCVGIIDIGEQFNSAFKNYSNKIMLIWEIPDVTIEVDGEQKPRWLSKEYASSLSDKSNLTKDLNSWRGVSFTKEEMSSECDGFDLSSMLGMGAILSVTVETKESGSYNKITAVSGMIKGMPAPEPQNPLILFDMDNWSDEEFEKIPTWIQDKIKKSTQYQKKYAKDEQVDFPKAETQQVAEVGKTSTNGVQPQQPIKAPF